MSPSRRELNIDQRKIRQNFIPTKVLFYENGTDFRSWFPGLRRFRISSEPLITSIQQNSDFFRVLIFRLNTNFGAKFEPTQKMNETVKLGPKRGPEMAFELYFGGSGTTMVT